MNSRTLSEMLTEIDHKLVELDERLQRVESGLDMIQNNVKAREVAY